MRIVLTRKYSMRSLITHISIAGILLFLAMSKPLSL